MKKEITFKPAFDKRNSDASKDYGIHGCDLKFILQGNEGAVQFVVYTNWLLKKNQEELDKTIRYPYPHLMCHPMPADLGYHSPTPHYEDQEPLDCDLLPNKKCYYDGSTFNAEPIYEILTTEGSEGVWKKLEEYYNSIFNPGTEMFEN